MTKFLLSSWPISKTETGDNYYVHVTERAPMQYFAEGEGLKGAQALFAEFEAKAIASGIPMAVYITLARGEKAPRGFKAWTEKFNRPQYVNADKL